MHLVWQGVVRRRRPKMAIPLMGRRDMGATTKTLGSGVAANTLSFPMGAEAVGPEAKAVDPAMAAELVGPGAEAGMLQAAVVSCREPE